jgi:hypothetical protein
LSIENSLGEIEEMIEEKDRKDDHNFRRRSLEVFVILVAVIMVTSLLVLPNGEAETNDVEIVMDDPVAPEYYFINTTIWDDLDFIDPGPIIIPIYFSLPMVEVRAPAHDFYMIMLVNSTLLHSPGVSERVDRYADDVERTGLGCWVWEYRSGSPQFIKDFLVNHSSKLVGTFFVGNIPTEHYEMWTDWDGNGVYKHERFPCDLFYTDLDGNWWDGSGDGMFDNHTDGSGDVEPEIWLGRLKADDMSEPEVDLVNNYFDKNNDYRRGNITFPQHSLVYVDDDWSPNPVLDNAVSKFTPSRTLVQNKATTIDTDYKSRVDSNAYSLVHVQCHGNPGGHRFKAPNATGDSVWQGSSITGTDYRNMDARVLLYNLFVCSGARFTSTDYVGGWTILTDTYSLASVGSTKTGSMRNEEPFYDPLGDGFRLGTSFQKWFEVEGEVSRPWYYGMAVLGDPTLRMAGSHRLTIETPGLMNANDVVHIWDGVSWTDEDIVNGKFESFLPHGADVYIDQSISGSTYTTTDPTYFRVVEPQTWEVEYYSQFQVNIQTSGLPSAYSAEVSYVQNGVSKVKMAWDGQPFDELCDQDTTVLIENPVVVAVDEERYISTGATYWTVTGDITATVSYFHQYYWEMEIETIGLTELAGSNRVTILSTAGGLQWTVYMVDGILVGWLDAGSDLIFSDESSESTSTHRWRTTNPVHPVTGPGDIIQNYWEQFLCSAEVTGTCLSDNGVYGLVHFDWFGMHVGNAYNDTTDWSEWCDAGTNILFSKIVTIDAVNRCHTNDTVSDTVTSSETYPLEYHHEIKLTIMAEGLPDTQSTEVTISTADPSPSDDVAGGDMDDYVVTLNSANSFTWFNWVHFDTPLTADQIVTVTPNEKYLLICWSEDGTRHAPPTVNADEAGLTYTAHYIGVKKEMSHDLAVLTQPVMVYINVSGSSGMEAGDEIMIIDHMPNEFSYVPGTSMVNMAPLEPTVIERDGCGTPYQELRFQIGEGDNNISFEMRINRAHATDHTAYNSVSAVVSLEGFDPVMVSVMDSLVIKVYKGPTLSSHMKGPRMLFMMDHGQWEFTFIVKNNHARPMMDAVMWDRFHEMFCPPPIFCFQPTMLANLLTDPQLSCIYHMMPPNLYWFLGDVAPGEAFMLQFTLRAEMEPPISYGWSLQSLNLDAGAMLLWEGEPCYDHYLRVSPLRVWLVPFPIWFV